MGGQAKVFTTVPGSVLRIGSFGDASNDMPAIVPEEVAAEFDGQEGFKVERDEPAKKAPAKAREK
jgi:hypothetical protein